MKEIQDQIVEEFSFFEDWLDKYNYLIELGGGLGTLDDKYRNDKFLIDGCQSRVWVAAELVDGKIIYSADSDAIITKGIVALLMRVLSGNTPKEILESELYFIDKIGLKENLSPTRSNGLAAMVKQMKLYALVFAEKA